MAEVNIVTLTQEELKNIRDIQTAYQEITFQLGQTRVQQLTAVKKSINLENQFEELQSKETKMFEVLNSKYGPGSFNLQSGEFTPAQPQA